MVGGDAVAASAAKMACINKLATSTDDATDRTGLAYGQVSLGANCNPMNVKWFLVTVNSSTSADFLNLITATITDAATPSNFRIARSGNTDDCNNTTKDVSKGPMQCWISVEFMPQGTATGAKTATIAASGGSSGSASQSLTGTATGPLTIKPSAAEFGTVVVNEAGTTAVTLTVANWSTTSTLGPVQASLSGAAAGDFRLVFDSCTDYFYPTPDKPGLPQQTTASCSYSGNNTCQVAYIFFPTAIGNRTATFTLTAGAVTSTATLHGTGVAETTITSTPATLAFGGIVLSNKSDWQTVTVNAGAGGVETGTLQFTIIGPNSNQFEVATGLDAGSCGVTDSQRLGGSNPMSCTIKVRFIPGVAIGLGAQKATLQVVDPRDRTLTQQIALTGTGLTQLTINPTSADFGLLAAGEGDSPTVIFTVTNRGTATITSPSLTVTGPFQWTPGASDCPNDAGTIAGNGGQCLVTVNLSAHNTPKLINVTPGVVIQGPTSGDNKNESKAAAQLSATVQADAVLELVGLASATHATTSTIDLGMAPSGGTGGRVTLLFRNTGGHATTPIQYYFWNGTSPTGLVVGQLNKDADDFVVSKSDPSADSCLGQSLKGGQYCMVNVDFKPTHSGIGTAGDLYAGFELRATIGGSTTAQNLVVLEGHGTDGSEKLTITPAFKSLIGTPASISLTLNSPAGSEEATQTATAFQITSTYNATLTLGFAIDSASFVQATDIPSGTPQCPATGIIGPSGSCAYWVKFLPTDATVPTDIEFQTGTLTVTATGANTARAGMMGKVRNGAMLEVWNQFSGSARMFAGSVVDSPLVDFGSVARQLASAAMPFTVMNIGDAPTSGNVSVKMIGTGPIAQFSATGCGSAAGALAAFSPTAPSGVANCPAGVLFTPTIAGVGAVVNEPNQPVQLEADAVNTTWNGVGGAAIGTGLVGVSHLIQGTCINPATLVVTPTGSVTISGTGINATAVGNESDPTFFTITNGAATSTLTIPDFQSTSTVTVSLTEGSAASTNFRLDLDPNDTDPNAPQTCEKAKDQVTGNLILVGNQQCVVAVVFGPQAMPASGAAFSATLSAAATTGGTSSVTVNATGRDDLAVTMIGATNVTDPSTAVVAFGSVTAGSVSSPDTGIDVQITNAGPSASGLLNTVVTGEFFVAQDTCNGTSVAAGGSCHVFLQFAPTTAAAKTGTLTVSGTPGGTASIKLSGTGI